MRICYLDHYAGSLQYGMEFRPYYLAREWVKAGHEVHIIAASYSHLRHKNPAIDHDFSEEVIDGIHYHWLKSHSYHGNGFSRAFTMFSFVAKLWLKAAYIAKRFQPDVVIASSTYQMDTWAAQRIARKAAARLIHEVHDMWPATLYEIGGMSRLNPFVQLIGCAERSFCRHSDVVVSILPSNREYFVNLGMRPEVYHYIPNGIVWSDWQDAEALPAEHDGLLRKLRADGYFIVGYFGGHALSNYLDIYLEAAGLMKQERVAFVLVGDGVEKAKLQEAARQMEQVYFLPSVPKKAIPSLVPTFDAVFIGSQPTALNRFGFGLNKLYDTMMAERPIIYAVQDPYETVERAQCGVTVHEVNAQSIVSAIRELQAMDAGQRAALGQNGQKYVLAFHEYGKMAKDFAELFKS